MSDGALETPSLGFWIWSSFQSVSELLSRQTQQTLYGPSSTFGFLRVFLTKWSINQKSAASFCIWELLKHFVFNNSLKPFSVWLITSNRDFSLFFSAGWVEVYNNWLNKRAFFFTFNTMNNDDSISKKPLSYLRSPWDFFLLLYSHAIVLRYLAILIVFPRKSRFSLLFSF